MILSFPQPPLSASFIHFLQSSFWDCRAAVWRPLNQTHIFLTHLIVVIVVWLLALLAVDKYFMDMDKSAFIFNGKHLECNSRLLSDVLRNCKVKFEFMFYHLVLAVMIGSIGDKHSVHFSYSICNLVRTKFWPETDFSSFKVEAASAERSAGRRCRYQIWRFTILLTSALVDLSGDIFLSVVQLYRVLIVSGCVILPHIPSHPPFFWFECRFVL